MEIRVPMVTRIALNSDFARRLLLTAILIVNGRQVDGQPPPPAFDVASIKPIGRPPSSGGGPWTVNHGRFKADAAWVRGVIGWAYGVLTVQVRGGPDWVDSERYDFLAKAESPDAGPDEIREMLRTLLAERFKLVTRRETQQITAYTLVIRKERVENGGGQRGKKELHQLDWKGPRSFHGMQHAGIGQRSIEHGGRSRD
jgi:hypothetical protein